MKEKPDDDIKRLFKDMKKKKITPWPKEKSDDIIYPDHIVFTRPDLARKKGTSIL